MAKPKVLLLGMIATTAIGLTFPSIAAALAYYVGGNPITAAQTMTGSLLVYSNQATIETYVPPGETRYAFRCVQIIAKGKIEEAGDSERELGLGNYCRVYGYSMARAPVELKECSVSATLKFAGKLEEVIGNDLWTGSEAEKVAGKVVIGGATCAAKGEYQVKGEVRCSILEPELESIIHPVLCAPAGLASPTALTMKKEGAGEPAYQMRFWYYGEFYIVPAGGVYSRWSVR